MIQYMVVLLDDKSVSFCHYKNEKKENRLIPIETLQSAILYAMKENLNVQFVYPSYPLPKEYDEAIESVDHIKIKSAKVFSGADVVVFDNIDEATAFENYAKNNVAYVIRTGRKKLFAQSEAVALLLTKVKRLNIVVTDVSEFCENDFKDYSDVLATLSKEVERQYVDGSNVQLNILTDRMMLDKMNNCGAGDTSITLAPDGKFYICPAFYLSDNGYYIGELTSGLDIKNPQLYKLDHAPICSNCDAWQCKRCIWLNQKLTLEVNTPSHEQCVIAHLERNASRKLLINIRKHGTFLPEKEEIKAIDYLDPFDVRKNWD